MRTPRDRVHEQVTIANIQGARESPLQEYDAIVTTCQDSIEDHVPESSTYHFFEMADGEQSEQSSEHAYRASPSEEARSPDNQYGGRSDYQFFERAARTTLTHLVANDDILIHCHAGASRSVSVSIAAIGAYENQGYHETFADIKEERPQANPDSLLREHAIRFIEEETGIAESDRFM